MPIIREYTGKFEGLERWLFLRIWRKYCVCRADHTINTKNNREFNSQYQGNKLDLHGNKSVYQRKDISQCIKATSPALLQKRNLRQPRWSPQKADTKNLELLEHFLQTFILALKNDRQAKDKITRIKRILDEKY
ncbi:hypothetical protein BKH46_02125 [Helicobacter sp. 12S02634-8]|nr:hypothetical protein BKH46_02125 [Helicobacter sp. 12S02634-8]